jgi:soluble lytic murein transglycosylase-like protein
MQRIVAISGAICALVLLAGMPARADYALLQSGQRLHITGYERDGEMMRLTMEGGSLEMPAAEIVAIEPEDVFTASAAVQGVQGPFADLIHAAAVKQGLDEELIASVIAAESNFDPHAVSPRQALGLMQLRPETAAQYSVSNVFDPAQNIAAGAHYLRDLLDRYRGDLRLALAAYNAGPDRVEQYHGIPPYPETISYIRRVTQRFAAKKQFAFAGK